MLRKPKDSSEALTAFLAKKTEIDTALARLTALSANHFGVDPDSLNWGDVGTLGFYAEQLRHITDAAFKEGEHAD